MSKRMHWILAALLWSFATLAHAEEPDACVHVVVSGDTVSGIAAKAGISQRELVELNPKLAANRDALKLGQKLKLCSKSSKAVAVDDAPKTKDDGKPAKKDEPAAKKPEAAHCGVHGRIVKHEVASGDTLAGIALQYAVPERDILARNSKLAADPDKLAIGQKLAVCVEDADRAKPGKIVKAKECGGETPIYVHEVVPGEHLAQIAGRYGVRKSDLLRLNAKLRSNPDKLSVGSTIRVCPQIPPRERTRIDYVVSAGENIGTIAEKFGASPREVDLWQQGKLKDRNAIREGQKLVVWSDGPTVRGFGGQDVDTGTLKSGMQLRPGKGYVVKWDGSAWGTTKTVRAIEQAVAAYKKKAPTGPKIHIGDISRKHGGKFSPHISHQHGRDVDIGYVLQGPDADETKFRHATAKSLDVPRTWALIKSFVDTDQVTYIFMDYKVQKMLYEHAESKGVSEDTLDELFQYPRGRGRSHGIIRHWRGHSNHFHVRFRP
ncbi:MAG: penicillin-insensitive murein endopeptidase [Deltaproteobacteria bacterium]|nr:penicillin-insensitive murein endopeptidase [Nannocystaceae bacterium]